MLRISISHRCVPTLFGADFLIMLVRQENATAHRTDMFPIVLLVPKFSLPFEMIFKIFLAVLLNGTFKPPAALLSVNFSVTFRRTVRAVPLTCGINYVVFPAYLAFVYTPQPTCPSLPLTLFTLSPLLSLSLYTSSRAVPRTWAAHKFNAALSTHTHSQR